MNEEVEEIKPEDLKEILEILKEMEPLLDKLDALEDRVVKILKPKLRHPETGKKIRIPFEVKDPDTYAKLGDGRSTFRFWCIDNRREWINKVLNKHFPELA
ncbi:MAG: hypothetical protein ACFFCS_16300 [Candidatus Hodarchaeota archaeon]